MASEIAGVTEPPDDHRDLPPVPQEGGTCVQCRRVVAVPFRFGSGVCEHCLFGLGLASLDSEPADFGVDAPPQTTSSGTWGAYRLDEEIGRGGMGVIYRAVHRATSEVVAIKSVLPEHANDEETLARFQREAEAVQSLDHPHAMPIFEVGCSDQGLPFFSMRLALGGSLHHLIEKYRGRWRQTAELMVKISGAVHHAHLRGILHRDIKPGNILFTEDYEPLVTDFGLAKPLAGSSDLTRSFAVLGTPTYIAPEQAAGKTRELTAAADIYSLGAVLYELLTGRTPFIGENPLEVLEQVGKKSPVSPRHLTPAIPKALEQICMRCLERAPEDRYASAQELADDLEHWMNGRRPIARPAYPRLRRLIRRHPARSAVCIGVGVLVAILWFGLRIAGHFFRSLPSTSVAVIIDDLEQDASSRLVARRLADELRRDLSASEKFSLPSEPDDLTSREAVIFDPLAYGRALKTQAVLTCFIRQAGDQTRLVAQLLQCDTGKVVWRRTETLSRNQTDQSLPTVVNTLVGNLLGNWQAPEHGRDKINSHSPLPDAQTFYTRAMELTKHGNRRDMEDAIALFRKASEADPQYVDARAMLAFALWTLAYHYDESDQYALAIQVAQKTLALDPDCAQAHRVIAACNSSEARYPEALREYERAVELNPLSAGCCLSLGICLREMGDCKKAIPWLKRAAKLEPVHGTFHATLAEAYMLCDLDAEAEASVQRAVELEQDQPDSQFALVAMRTWQKRFEEAHRLCSQARRRFPDYRFGLNFAAWLDFCDGNLPEAQRCFETLHAENSYQKRWVFHGAINPASALAYIAKKAGSSEQTRLLTDEALRLDFDLLAKYPHNCRILHDLAATYATTGDEQKAIEYLRQSLAAGWAEHRSTEIDPRFEAIASNPVFRELLAGTRPSQRENDR